MSREMKAARRAAAESMIKQLADRFPAAFAVFEQRRRMRTWMRLSPPIGKSNAGSNNRGASA